MRRVLENDVVRLLDGERVGGFMLVRVRHANPRWGWHNLMSYRYLDRPELPGGTMPEGRFKSLPRPGGACD